MKLLRWSVHWQDQTFAAKLCNSFCETFAVKHPLIRRDLCCETLQFILWNFCSEASTDKTGRLLRNFAIHFVKVLPWSVHWQDWTFAAKLCNSFCETFATKHPLRDWTFAAKLCNSFCKTFAVKHPLTRPDLCCETLQFICETFAAKHPLTRLDLCCETLQFILWNFCCEASTDKTGPLLWDIAINFVKRLRWSVQWQNRTFAAKLCNSFCKTFAVKHPLTDRTFAVKLCN